MGPGGRGEAYHQVDPYKVPELVEDLLTGFLVPLRLAPEFYVGDLDVSLNLKFWHVFRVSNWRDLCGKIYFPTAKI